MKTAVVFAGQGAQSQGMGLDFVSAYEPSRSVMDTAENISGMALASIIAQGLPELNETRVTQPAVASVSAAIFAAFKDRFKGRIDAVLGFSLGEYVALYATGIMTLEDMLRTVTLRAKWMDECAKAVPGAMAAVIQAQPEKLKDLCENISANRGYVAIANYNSPQQLVVSGTVEGIEALTSRMAETGAKRIVRLNTSGGFHTPLMRLAAEKLKAHLESIELGTPVVPIILNATASAYVPGTLPDMAKEQTMGPVRFVQSIETLIASGVTRFIEIGPGAVLSGLIKKINPEVETIAIQTVSDLVNMEEKA